MSGELGAIVVTIVILGAIFVFAALSSKSSTGSSSTSKPAPRPRLSDYRYTRKRHMMTAAEADLFRRLERIAGAKYYIFPQVHLSSLLEHTTTRQNWKAALSKIQRKSVDYVLVEKSSLESRYAIELDDSSHDNHVRAQRDSLVAEIFADAGIPLVRLRNIGAMTDDDVSEAIRRSAPSNS